MKMLTLVFVSCALFAQATFEVATVKPSQRTLGKDAESQIVVAAAGLSGRNVTLKQLIVEAYGLQPHQVAGPNWIDNSEYDVDARAGGPATREQLRVMLRALLAERFGLTSHTETKEMKVYELVVDKDGPKIRPAADAGSAKGGGRAFHGSMQQFANLLALKLTIPVMDDPGRPGIASGAPVPVLDKTGLTGVYDFNAEVRLEPGADMFTMWQRLLQDQLGLKLESRKSNVEIFTVDRAARIPSSN
jgi:uncharacterized protein (TIGR03435 family)